MKSSITEIGAEAFIECPNLKNITLHTLNDSVLSTFYGMIDVIGDVNLTIDSVTAIADMAFGSLNGLKSINILDGVSTIGISIVYQCENLESVYIGKGVTSFSENKSDTGIFEGCVKLSKIIVSNENPVYKSEGNCIINKSTKTLIAGCKSSVIPEDGSVEKIGTFAFSGMTELKSIIIPNSVEEIGDFAFAITGLVSIKIPFSVVKIGMCAFFETNSVENIIFENTEGWQCDGNSIPEEQLSDSSNAAQMLKSDEYSGIWTRSE